MADAQDTRSTYRICPLCEACCGLQIKTQGDKVIGIRGAETDVFRPGYICPKGYALKDLHEDPDRLCTPLIRCNGALHAATWDEAFAEIERRLLPILVDHGPDAVARSIGNPAAHKFGLLLYFNRLAKAIGTKNIYSVSTLDQMPKQLSSGWMIGHWLSVAVPDIERCEHLLVIGANPVARNGSLWTVSEIRGKAKALRARGGKLVVIDPRRTETAEVADAHHAIRPGADVFLLAAIAHTLFDEGLLSTGRLTPHLNGPAEVQSATRPFNPEAVAAGCGISASTIRQRARELAAAPHACVYARIGTCTQTFGTLNSWLVDVLNVLILDICVNETSRHADVILPGLSPLQDSHCDVPFPQLSFRNHARSSGPVFDAPADHPPEWMTLLRLAALAQGHGAHGARLSLAAQRRGVNMNVLLDEGQRDLFSGNAVLSGVAAKLTALAMPGRP